MEEFQKTANHQEDEITLKELIDKLLEYFWYIIQYWKFIAILAVICVSYFLFKAITTPITYKAELTFMVNEDEGNSLGGVSGILGNFGISTSVGGQYNLEKIIELSKSMKIVQSVLLHKCEVDGSFDMIANHLIKEYNLHKEWEDSKNKNLHGFLFVNDSLHLLNATEKSVLKKMYNRIIDIQKENGEFTSAISEGSGIMQFAIETTSQELSIAFAETLYEKLSVYYVEKTVSKQQLTYDLVKSKTDSLAALLSQKEIELALFRDKNRRLFSQREQLRESVLQREVTMLTLMYGESIKNLEIADFALKTKTPFVQIIDRPFPPLYPIFQSKLIAIVKGLFLGGFLAIGFLIGRKIILDALKEDG